MTWPALAAISGSGGTELEALELMAVLPVPVVTDLFGALLSNSPGLKTWTRSLGGSSSALSLSISFSSGGIGFGIRFFSRRALGSGSRSAAAWAASI